MANVTQKHATLVDHLIFGAAAALYFYCPEDEQSVEMMDRIQTEGVEKALADYTGLSAQEPLFGRILIGR